jgi:hypothetical protein
MAGARTVPNLLSSSRCPFCHDDVAPTKSVACEACLARHHCACWTEAGRCASCGSCRALHPQLRPIDQTVVRRLLSEAGYDAGAIDAHFAGVPPAPGQARCPVRTRGALCNLAATHRIGHTWLCALHASHEQRGLAVALGVLGLIFLGCLGLGAHELAGDPAHTGTQFVCAVTGALTVALVGLAARALRLASRLEAAAR